MIKLNHISLIMLFGLPYSSVQAWNPFGSLWNKFNDNVVAITTVAAASLTFFYARYLFKTRNRQLQEQIRKFQEEQTRLKHENERLRQQLENTTDSTTYVDQEYKIDSSSESAQQYQVSISRHPEESAPVGALLGPSEEDASEKLAYKFSEACSKYTQQKEKRRNSWQVVFDQYKQNTTRIGWLLQGFLNPDTAPFFKGMNLLLNHYPQTERDAFIKEVRDHISPADAHRCIGAGGSRCDYTASVIALSIYHNNDDALTLWLSSSELIPQNQMRAFLNSLNTYIMTSDQPNLDQTSKQYYRDRLHHRCMHGLSPISLGTDGSRRRRLEITES